MIKKMLSTLGLCLSMVACGGYQTQNNSDPAQFNYASVPDESQCNWDGNCRCNVAVARIQAGLPHNSGDIYHNMGSDDPAHAFRNGGSENIGVTCRTAKFLKDGDPKWFEGYFDIHLNQPDIAHGGRELFSATYMSLTAGHIVTVLNHAKKRNKTALVKKASHWLRTYWALLAMGSRYNRPGTEVIHRQGHKIIERKANSAMFGMGTIVPNNRAYVNRNATVGFQPMLLAIALQKPGRRYNGDLNGSPGFYGGLRSAIVSLGYNVGSTGKVNLTARSIPPELVGLNEIERQQIMDFIKSNGRQNVSQVLGMIAPYKLKCNLTFRRTDNGIAAWFGDSTGNYQKACSRAKGGPVLATTFDFIKDKAHFLSSSYLENHPEPQGSWREGNRLCVESDRLPKNCIDMPNGNVIWEVLFSRNKKGFKCIEGNCGSNYVPPGPGPTPTPTPPPVTDPPPPPPSDSGSNPDSQALPAGAAGNLVDTLYMTYLLRLPGAGGKAFWMDIMQSRGKHAGTWGAYHALSEEFYKIALDQGKFAGLTAEQIVQRWYKAYLRRCGGAGGVTYWADFIRAGQPMTALRGIMRSGEAKEKKSQWLDGPPSNYNCN